MRVPRIGPTLSERGVALIGTPGCPALVTELLRKNRYAIVSDSHILRAGVRFLHGDGMKDGMRVGPMEGLAFCGFSESQVLAPLREMLFGWLEMYVHQTQLRAWVNAANLDIFAVDDLQRLLGGQAHILGVLTQPLTAVGLMEAYVEAAGCWPTELHRYLVIHPRPLQALAHAWSDSTHAMLDLAERNPSGTRVWKVETLATEAAARSDLLSWLGLGTEAADFAPLHLAPTRRVQAASAEIADIVRDAALRAGYEPLPVSSTLSPSSARNRLIAGLKAQRLRSKGGR